MVFQNLYYKRTAAATKACYICYKPTATVLATIDTTDFFYACPVHLTDRGFATHAPDPEPEPKKPSVSPEEIAQVKQEWEKRRRQMSGKTQKKEEGDGKDGEGGAQKDADGKEANTGDSKQEKKTTNAVVPPSPPSSEKPIPRPTHERYVLHRDIFALRTADHRRRRQTAQAKDLAPRLPGAPRSALP